MILSEKIMQLRKKNGWSQEELAEKLSISRQSVSKWESGASIPDIDKIITMSGLFGVSTDYLLKDELEQEQYSETEDVYEKAQLRSVSLEEANLFMNQTGKMAGRIGAAVSLCILSPIPLILLGGFAEYGKFGISENMAGGFGVTILLVLIALAVGVMILNGMKMEKYEYLEKEEISLQYGVQGIVAKRKEDFADTYRACVVAGVVLCILGVVPIMVAAGFDASDLVLVYCTAGLLAVLAVGVFLFVWSGCIQGSFQKLLQEGDYTSEKKSLNKKTSFFPGVYWCLVTAIFLCFGFSTDNWKFSGLIWPVAALLFVVRHGMMRAVAGAKQSKEL